MNITNRATLLAGSIVPIAVCLGASSVAEAQAAAEHTNAVTAPAVAAAPATGEVIVTAQKRSQNVQKVPLSITVITPQAIEENHLRDFSDLSALTPSFTSGANYGYIRNSSMRGISNNQYGFADDPSIAMYVDGIYQGRGGTGMQENALYDVNRVEIVKGPQATLFGQSSIAGAIDIVENQPTQTQSATGSIGLGERGRLVASAADNMPLSPDFAVRVAVDYEHLGGYIRNLNGGPDLSPLDVFAGRAIARYTGISNLDASLKVSYEHRREDGSIHEEVGLPAFTSEDSLRGDQNFAIFDIFEVDGKLKYQVDPSLSISSDTSYRAVGNAYVEDYGGTATIVGGPYYQHSWDKLFQEDARINYTPTKDISLIVGGSTFDESMNAFIGNWVDHTFAFTGVPGVGLIPGDYSQAFFEDGYFFGHFNGGSAFADGTTGVFGISGWTITGGVRWNYDHKEYEQDVPNPAVLPMNAGKAFAGAYYNWGYWTSTPIIGGKSWQNVSYRLASNYDINPNNTVYVQYAQGWKAGGIDTTSVITPPGSGFSPFFGEDASAFKATLNTYNPEQSDSYEIGLKGNALDHRLIYSFTLYDYVYRNLQVAVAQSAGSIIENIGLADGRGAEFEVRFVPDDHWDLFANGAYNYTNIVRFPVPPGTPSQVGLPLNQAPLYNGAFGATYKWDAPEFLGGQLSIAGTGTARSSYRTAVNLNDVLRNDVKGYVLFNMRLGWVSKNGRYSLTAFADNVANTFTYSRFSAKTAFIYPVNSYQVIGEPRTIGVDLSAKF